MRLEIATPKDLPSGRSVRVDETGATPVEHVKVVATTTTFAVFWDEDALALATLLKPGTVHLKLDLRPLGINIYDDPLGLHIGQNTFSGNQISHSAVAINLGD